MIGETILHYPPKTDQPLADKIVEKLGEVRLLPIYRDGRDLVPIHIYGERENKL